MACSDLRPRSKLFGMRKVPTLFTLALSRTLRFRNKALQDLLLAEESLGKRKCDRFHNYEWKVSYPVMLISWYRAILILSKGLNRTLGRGLVKMIMKWPENGTFQTFVHNLPVQSIPFSQSFVRLKREHFSGHCWVSAPLCQNYLHKIIPVILRPLIVGKKGTMHCTLQGPHGSKIQFEERWLQEQKRSCIIDFC